MSDYELKSQSELDQIDAWLNDEMIKIFNGEYGEAAMNELIVSLISMRDKTFPENIIGGLAYREALRKLSALADGKEMVIEDQSNEDNQDD